MSTGFAFLFCALALASAQQNACDSNEMDPCGEKLLQLFIYPETFPVNAEEMENTCKNMREGLTCVDEVRTRCPNIVPESIAEAFIETTTGNINDLCKEGSSLIKKIVKHGSCIRDKLSKNQTCVPNFIRHVEATRSLAKEWRLPSVCCGMAKFDKCYLDEVTAVCQNEAGRTSRRIVQGFALFLADKCLSYLADPKKCDNVPPAVLQGPLGVKTVLPGLTSAFSQ